MTIYIDIIFVENILMNYIILFATLVIIKSRTKYQQIRLIVSSIIGSCYAVIIYLNILSIYSNIFAKIVLSIIMVYVAFGAQNVKLLLKQILIFYLVSFIFGGCTVALIYFIKPENVKINNGVFVGTYPIKVTLIAGVVAFIVTQIAFRINKNKLNSKNTFFDIEIFFEEKTLKVRALLDSGNMLTEPISKLPVIIVEKEELKKIISKDFLNYIENFMGGDAEKQYDEDNIQKYLSKVRMVPFMSIGKENGMLIGIRIDKTKIETEDINIERKNVIVGIYDKKLTKDNKYNALIGLNLLEGENENEFATTSKK
ncbi:MAG: sigma-E processing peptidase SpoIIGA [Clostridia bacterium]